MRLAKIVLPPVISQLSSNWKEKILKIQQYICCIPLHVLVSFRSIGFYMFLFYTTCFCSVFFSSSLLFVLLFLTSLVSADLLLKLIYLYPKMEYNYFLLRMSKSRWYLPYLRFNFRSYPFGLIAKKKKKNRVYF